ncbi:MAG: endonuclease/exonuclease/phosphatase family protein [Pseudonocardiales bacterium]
MASVTVASWNIREALPVASTKDVEYAREELVATVLDYGIDVLAMQEVDFSPVGDSATLRHVAARTGLVYHVARALSPSSYFDGHRAGVAIASRFPLPVRAEGEFLNPGLSTTLQGYRIASHDKGFVAATVQGSSEFTFRVISLHAVPYHLFDRDAEDEKFRRVWEDIASTIVPFAGEPLVVCGDFNASNRRLFLDAGDLALTQVFPGVPTYKGMSVDDVLVSKHFRSTGTKVLANFSDHLLCLARLVL